MSDLERLAAPFPADDVEWRLQSAGQKNDQIWARALAYITNRAIQNRLDDVCGPENWSNQYKEGPGGGVLCGISIHCAYGWVTKWDGAENTDVESVKGGLSGAMKRAAVQWGIGRYLYNLSDGWAKVNHNGAHRGSFPKDKRNPSGERVYFRWDAPDLPDWALPDPTEELESLRTKITEAMEAVELTDEQENRFMALITSSDTAKMRKGLAWLKEQA